MRLVGIGAFLLAACGSSSSGGGSPGDGAVQTGSVSCSQTCPGVLAANCPNGPVDQADCVSGCESIKAGPCNPRFQTLMTCAGASPRYACDSAGAVTITGCETQYTAMVTCLQNGGP
jgi:hypothetical protein